MVLKQSTFDYVGTGMFTYYLKSLELIFYYKFSNTKALKQFIRI